MSQHIQKMTWDEFTTAAKAAAIAGGVAALAILPKKHSILPVLKKPVADAAKITYDEAIPKAAQLGSEWVEKTGVEKQIRNKTVDFLYDTLSQYNATLLLQTIADKIPTSQNVWARAFGNFFTGILNGEDKRTQLCEELSEAIFSLLRKLFDGKAVSIRVNGNIEKTIQTGIAGILETLLTTPAATSTMNMILDERKKLDRLNAGGILEDALGLDKQGMSDFIDSTCSKYFGKEMVDNLKAEKKGEAMATQIMDLDPDDLREKIKNEYMDEVLEAIWKISTAALTLRRVFHKKK